MRLICQLNLLMMRLICESHHLRRSKQHSASSGSSMNTGGKNRALEKIERWKKIIATCTSSKHVKDPLSQSHPPCDHHMREASRKLGSGSAPVKVIGRARSLPLQGTNSWFDMTDAEAQAVMDELLVAARLARGSKHRACRTKLASSWHPRAASKPDLAASHLVASGSTSPPSQPLCASEVDSHKSRISRAPTDERIDDFDSRAVESCEHN
jgi:hypothetical protein